MMHNHNDVDFQCAWNFCICDHMNTYTTNYSKKCQCTRNITNNVMSCAHANVNVYAIPKIVDIYQRAVQLQIGASHSS